MKTIKGIQIGQLSFELEKMGDLICYEGPVFSHFVSGNDEDFLFFWVEADDKYNRWMVYKTNADLLNNFFQKKISNRDMVQSCPDGFVYFIDINDDIEYQRIYLTAIEDIPHNYLPPTASFFDPKHYEGYSLKLKSYLEFYFSRKSAIKQNMAGGSIVPEGIRG